MPLRRLPPRQIRQPGRHCGFYKRIITWSEKRNTAIHQAVKYGANKSRSAWGARYKSMRRTVDSGHKLAREISDKVESLNRKDRKSRSAKGSSKPAIRSPVRASILPDQRRPCGWLTRGAG